MVGFFKTILLIMVFYITMTLIGYVSCLTFNISMKLFENLNIWLSLPIIGIELSFIFITIMLGIGYTLYILTDGEE